MFFLSEEKRKTKKIDEETLHSLLSFTLIYEKVVLLTGVLLTKIDSVYFSAVLVVSNDPSKNRAHCFDLNS